MSNAERVIYARISLPENAQEDHGHIFDYIMSSWIRCQEVIGKIRSLAQLPDVGKYMDFEDIAERRIQGLTAVRSVLLNYSGLVLNLDMADCFPVPERYQNHVALIPSRNLDSSTLSSWQIQEYGSGIPGSSHTPSKYAGRHPGIVYE